MTMPRPFCTSYSMFQVDIDCVVFTCRGHHHDINGTPLVYPQTENGAFLRKPAHLGVRIVISSTWREAHSLPRLRALFAADLQPRILGVSPMLDEYDSDYLRYEEIKAWLDRHPDCSAWAALDDDVEGFPGHRRKTVVFTDPGVGLTTADLEALQPPLA